MKYRFEPKPDITAYELARILARTTHSMKISGDFIERRGVTLKHFSLVEEPPPKPRKRWFSFFRPA